jgi:hypothetical protein
LIFAVPPSRPRLLRVQRTATSRQSPHESIYYTTLDHLLSRVPPTLGAGPGGCNGFWAAPRLRTLSSMKLKLDLHDIYNRGGDIDRALKAIIAEAVEKKATLVEIIPGKGSGQLKKRVLRFLDQKEIKALYHRVEKDSKNFGRLFVHFKFK